MIEARILKHYAAARDSTDFSLDVEWTANNNVTALFGPSGSGKTLTLDSLAGFVNPDDGRILIDNAIVFDSQAKVSLPPRARRCGYVFQNYALFPHMSLRDNLMFAAEAIRATERPRKVNEMLEQFRLEDVAGRKPHEISGGQKQRCSIARALIASPRVLLLDEPAKGLDAPLRRDLYAILREVRTRFRTPMVLVTHHLEECFELADHMLVYQEGRIVQSGSPAAVAAQPSSLELAKLFGIFNILPVEIRSLDPSRNTSVLRLDEFEIQSEYYPGRLKGDRVYVLATPRQLRAMPRIGGLMPNQVPVKLQRVVETADGSLLEFEEGVSVEVPRGAVDRNNGNWVIEFPSKGLRIL